MKNDIELWLGAGSINIFGRPFAGKDTQGKRLADQFKGHLLGGGDILRNSIIPQHIFDIQAAGNLIPSADYVAIVLPYLKKAEFAGKPLILSSVGRWKGEEEGVIEALTEANHPLKAVIYLDISEEDVRKRWHALESHDDRHHRADDTLDILETRLQEYRDKTLPVIDEYEKQGLLIRVDGTKTPDEVQEHILQALASRASTSQ